MAYSYNDNYPSDFEAKRLILEIGKRMYAKGFVAANDGNISVKVSDNTIWCTPTGVSKGYMTEDMMVLMDLEGNVLRGTYKPSTEIKMHLRCYKENSAVNAVVHAHPPIATSFAIAGRPLNQAILTEAVFGVGEIPVAPYAMPGTEDVPNSIAPFVTTHNGCLLANHGALAWGKDAMEAWFRMESIEYYAQVSMYTHDLMGEANMLTCDQVDRLIQRRTNSGITTGGYPICKHCGPDGTRKCECGTCKGSSNNNTVTAEQDEKKMIAEIVQNILASGNYK